MGIFSRKKKNDADATVDVTTGAPVLDLREHAKKAEEAPPPVWGFPSRCPECGDYGYLDRIDVRLEVMFQHCPTCWARWETPRSATVDA